MTDSLLLPRPAYQAPHVATLLVSVFLQLLCFFIVLSSFSNFNGSRSNKVLNTVNKTFSHSMQYDELNHLLPPKRDISPITVNQIFDDVQSSVAQLIPLYEIEKETEGNLLRLKIPSLHLFSRGAPNLRKDRIDFYRVLSEALGRWGDSAEISVSMVQGLEPAEGAEARANAELAVTRAGNFARFLENRGVPPRHIRVALSDRNADTVTLAFEIRPRKPNPEQGGE